MGSNQIMLYKNKIEMSLNREKRYEKYVKYMAIIISHRF